MPAGTSYVEACTDGNKVVAGLMGVYAGASAILWFFIAKARRKADKLRKRDSSRFGI